MSMSSDAKRFLSTTIRGLRARLLADLHDATDMAYRFAIVDVRNAKLELAPRVRRQRLEAWMAEQVRAQDTGKGKKARNREDFRKDAEKQAAYTWLNRLILVRLMEAAGQRAPKVVTGGSESLGYKDFRTLAPALVKGDETEGYAFLLRLVFEDLAIELPGLFGPAGVAELIPMPAATLRHVVDAFDHPDLKDCWTDDMTLGWVYQYWNDPEREALDKKLNAGGKVEPHEIASKTQMFTERYMVDWLLQNSLGPMWLAMCRKHAWKPDAEAHGTFEALEKRRVAWRAQREAGQVTLTELMPLETDAERRWAWYLPQPIPADAVSKAPESIRDLKLIDPAVGSGHFLVIAFDLLLSLYREEARHRKLERHPDWTDTAIVEHIVGHNLHGIDLDPRAVQIAAAALWLKAKAVAPDARPKQLNLVAAHLRLAGLPDDDPALVELRREIERETGIPAALTDTLVHALRGADHLGSLLKVDAAVDAAIRAHEQAIVTRREPVQIGLFGEMPAQQLGIDFAATTARRTLLEHLEGFLSRHTTGDDLGLRLRGEQLAAGVRFVRMIREGTYDLVVGNPPYQGTAKLADSTYVQKHYPRGKADLYAAFLERGLQLARPGGVSALLTMRNWMFIKQYAELRQWLLATFDLRALGDFDKGAFEEIPDEVVSVSVALFRKVAPGTSSVALQPTSLDDRTRDNLRTLRKRAGVLAHVGRYDFDPAALKVVPEWPLVYWWSREFLAWYATAATLGHDAAVRQGLCTGDNARVLRSPWEVSQAVADSATWVPFVKGAEGRAWYEPVSELVWWKFAGLGIKLLSSARPQNEQYYFRRGVAFTTLGSAFRARVHRAEGIFGDMGRSVFGENVAAILCSMNSKHSARFMESINPTVHFTVGDVSRLPLFGVASADEILGALDVGFGRHESHREPSTEFRQPGASAWRYAQAWAQTAVDRPEGAPLPPYEPEYDAEPPTDHVSYALGCALGRFGDTHMPAGICFLDGTLEPHDTRDSLGHPAAAPLHAAWTTYGPEIDAKSDLRTWLRLKFFAVHKGMYENRPIHWPLSSDKKTFVAWIQIHRWTEQTLRLLLADHLHPTLARLDGELNDLREARHGTDKKAAAAAEKVYDRAVKARAELASFMAQVEQCADQGPPPTDATCPAREQDARYAPDLDDGVMVNSAALWPLLDPQWSQPKTWWKELSSAAGKKDYDWSHLAMRYWPTRVDEKCRADPSLGVAHGCFWRYHPARAWAWELRLQDEIGPDFRIDEPDSPPHRAAWLRDHPKEALAAVEKEALRRMGRAQKRRIIKEIRLLEPGLWTSVPGDVWDLELRLSEKQGTELRVLAPDEPTSRATFVAAHPSEAKDRAVRMDNLAATDLFGVPEDDSEDDPGVESAETEEGDE